MCTQSICEPLTDSTEKENKNENEILYKTKTKTKPNMVATYSVSPRKTLSVPSLSFNCI